MMPISGVNTGAVQPLTTAEKALGAPKVQKPEEEAQGRPLKPVMDQYVPEDPQEPSGRHWMGKGEDEVWEGNTDKVEREIEKLKKRRQELEQRLGTETDEAKIKELERQLAQVEQELQQKDNDTYRRQHTTVRQLS